jgi:hypothetical protein
VNVPPYLGAAADVDAAGDAVGEAAGLELAETGGSVLETVAGADEDAGGAAVEEGVGEPVLQPVIINAQTNRTTNGRTSFFMITSFNFYPYYGSGESILRG